VRQVPGISRRLLVPIGVSLLVVIGAVVTVVLATAPGPHHPVLAARPASSASARGVVPLLGTSADANGAVPAVSASSSRSSPPAAAPKVAALDGLRQADLLIVAPSSLPASVLTAVPRQAGVTSAVPIEAARVLINGTQEAVLGVDPSTFRGYAAGPTAASSSLWQGVADGGVAVSYSMGVLDKLALGRQVTVAGRQAEQLPVVAFGTVGIGGVDAVVSDSVATSLGMPASNAIVINASPASVAALTAQIKTVLPRGASVEPLVTVTTAPSQAGVTAPGGQAMSAAEITAALRAAVSRRGLPYVWGGAGPSSFDCSGLVQWSFAQAGVAMPRVAADQARTGPAVPVSQLQPGDLLFYYTDPTAPGYISHVAIYLGHGLMIQAPQPGQSVEVVPASFGAQFAGAVRVDPHLAAGAAGGVA
jgi:peptidoglycan DL-endopeptidase CwlO